MHPLDQLNLHLQLVATSLPLATRKRPETIHALRVNARHSLAALSMFSELLDPRELKWTTKHLRRIRRAAGDARDLDVLAQRYRKENATRNRKLLRRIGKLRRTAQRPIDRLTKTLIETGRFQEHVVQLMSMTMLDRKTNDTDIEDMMRASLKRTATKFFQASREHETKVDAKSLHRMRLRAKQLRYAADFCNPILDDEFRTTTYPIIAELQERLGNINDRVSAVNRLTKFRSEASSKQNQKQLRIRIKVEQQERQELITQFGLWWTQELTASLESAFSDAVATGSDQLSAGDLSLTTQWFGDAAHILL